LSTSCTAQRIATGDAFEGTRTTFDMGPLSARTWRANARARNRTERSTELRRQSRVDCSTERGQQQNYALDDRLFVREFCDEAIGKRDSRRALLGSQRAGARLEIEISFRRSERRTAATLVAVAQIVKRAAAREIMPHGATNCVVLFACADG